jgi:hypothetical protein
MTQREPSLLSTIVDPHDIRLQHFIMWRWVLLCDYCSYFYICRRPLKFDRLSMSTHYRHFSQVSLPFSEFVHHQNCPRFILTPPRRALQ